MSARDGEGFLTRWSRLKRVPDRQPEPDHAPATAATEPLLPEGRTLEDLVAELPRLDDLVPGQNLSAFMRSWVPNDIRKAALRRMWLLDPAIRDYVNPALDYAYDYNVVGGAPGYGPMETSAEMIQEVREMFARAVGGERGEGDQPIAEGNMSQAGDADASASPDDAAPPQAPQTLRGHSNGLSGADLRLGTTNVQNAVDFGSNGHSSDAAPQNGSENRPVLAVKPRRHGGALPG